MTVAADFDDGRRGVFERWSDREVGKAMQRVADHLARHPQEVARLTALYAHRLAGNDKAIAAMEEHEDGIIADFVTIAEWQLMRWQGKEENNDCD